MDWYTVFVLMHIIGTVLGVGGATFIEIYLINALRDGIVSPDESTIMQISYNTLRVGFFLLVISGFGFLILARLSEHNTWFYSLQFWAKLSIVGIIAINAVVMQFRLIPLLVGSSIALTSWYAALFLGVLRKEHYPILGVIAVYLVAIFIVYLILRAIHKKYIPQHDATTKN